MREIITIQLGQCGNFLGIEFWGLLSQEHGLNHTGYYIGNNDKQLYKINVHFNETRGLTYTPRAFLIDLDRSSLDHVRTSPSGKLFKPDNFIFGSSGAANNFAKGHFSEGTELCTKSLEMIRREVEGCDCFHGFIMFHSLGGGTGSGLGSLLLSKLRQEYKDRMIDTCSIIPSPKFSNSVVEPYNAILTFNHLTENTNETFCMDNEALYNIATNILKKKQANYCDLNCLISLAMSGITTCIRFPGPSNADLRKIAVNMVPFSRLHYFVPGFAPIGPGSTRKISTAELSSQLFDYRNIFTACDARKGKFLTLSCIYRGNMSLKEVDKQVAQMKNKQSNIFVEWIPNNVKTAVCSVPIPGLHSSATLVANTTAIEAVFNRINSQYSSMFKRKAFLHWFIGEGMEEGEFVAAESSVKDLVAEYKEHGHDTAIEPSPAPSGQSSTDSNVKES